MLTCDSFGVLPPVAKLSPEEAVEQFLLGYTSKVAGTEAGITEPVATFSPCFGLPFMPLPPERYGDLLRKKIDEHDVNCWLVNTGWTGGGYGVGKRMPISITRMIIDRILDGSLAKCITIKHSGSDLSIPATSEIPKEVLIPQLGWSSKEEYDKALNYISRALKINEELGNKSEIGSSFNSIGIIYHHEEKDEKALEYFKRYLSISEELGDKNKIGSSLNNIAVIYGNKGDYDQALDFYMRSLRIIEELDLMSSIALTLDNIGSIYAQKGEYDQALDHFSRALKISEDLGDKVRIGSSLGNIGWRYWGAGEYDKALDYYNRALEIWKELRSKSGIAGSLGSIGGVYWGKGEYDQALDYFSRALAINEELGNKSGIAGSLGNIGTGYIDMGKYDQALDYFSRALAINEELDNNQSIGISFSKIGIYYYFEGKYEKAIEYLEKSIHIHQEMGYKFFELHTATYLYLAYKQLGKDYNEQEIHRIIKEEKNIILFEVNFRLYELLEDESYLETAYKQIQEKADNMEDQLKENFLSYPIPKAIIEKYNKVRT